MIRRVFLFFLFSVFSLSAYTYNLSEPAWVYIGRAKRLLFQSNEAGKAMKLLNDVIGAEKTNAEAHYYLGEAYLTQAKETQNESETLYRVAISHYNAAITYAPYLSKPSLETEAFFKILSCYQIIADEYNEELTIARIEKHAKEKKDKTVSGRMYFELGKYCEQMGRDSKADEYYKLAFKENYRPKLVLYTRALFYRKMGAGYEQLEKQMLVGASRNEFENNSAENIKITRYIEQRLEELKEVGVYKGYKTPSVSH